MDFNIEELKKEKRTKNQVEEETSINTPAQENKKKKEHPSQESVKNLAQQSKNIVQPPEVHCRAPQQISSNYEEDMDNEEYHQELEDHVTEGTHVETFLKGAFLS